MTPLRALPLFVVALVATFAPAQAVDGALRALKAMEIAGLADFTRDRVAVALLGDATTYNALLRPLDAETATLVADRVRLLHRRGGYAHAEATGKIVDGVLRVDLHAGARFRCGEVSCTGNREVSTAALRERFAVRPDAPVWATEAEKSTARAEAQRAWVADEYPTMDDRAAERLQRIVRDAYHDRGRYGVQATVEFVPDGERMRLAVAVADEGREVRIHTVKLDGEDDAAAGAVLKAISFASDTLATTGAVDALRRELEATGRYVQVDVSVDDDAPASLDPLVFKVKARAGAPAMDAVSPRDLEQVRRAMRDLVARVERGDTIRIASKIAEPGLHSEGMHALPGLLVGLVNRTGVLVDVEQLQIHEAAPARTAVGLCDRGLMLRYGDVSAAWRSPAQLPFQLQMINRIAADGEMETRWGAGLKTRGQGLLELILHPALPRHLLLRASSVQRDGEVLSLRFGETTVRIAENGTLLDNEIAFAVSDQQVTVSWAPEGLADIERAFANAGDPTGFAATAARLLVDCTPSGAGRDARTAALLRECLVAVAVLFVEDAPSAAAAMPGLGEGPARGMPAVIGMELGAWVVSREYRGRLPEIGGAFACVLLGDSRAGKARFEALLADADTGPLSLGTIALAWGLLGNERIADAFRQRAASRVTFDHCWREVADLAASFPKMHGLPARIGARWRSAPELKDLFGDAAEGEAGDLAAWRKGLELLWNAGGEKLLRDALLAK